MPRIKKPLGIGGPMQHEVKNPNKPTFDPAEKMDSRDTQITSVLERDPEDLTDWEKNFLISVYAQSPLTRKQAICASKILKRFKE